RKPLNTVRQAERLKSEFEKLNVTCDLLYHGYLNLKEILKYDFAIYLDKDKYTSLYLSKNGLRLFNSHDSIRVCDDKGETYITLEKENIKIPKTIYAPLCYDKNEVINEKDADEIIKVLSLPVVVKESFGSMGKGVYKADTKEELLALMGKLKNMPHLYQEYLGKKFGEDIRVIVIGGKAVASMRRKNDKDFRSNIALGGKGEKIELLKEYKDIAEKSAKVLGLDYCGVDLLSGNDNEPVVCEVNSNAFFEEIENISKVNIAKVYCEYIIKKVGNHEKVK
ncbi:MAG: RimK family alpha-L-glutamate ligase, partial [Firmicutes bacterium]|nr:RimK family alpha-L-glutamate ligase [Candidatus Caballimonas caccae]